MKRKMLAALVPIGCLGTDATAMTFYEPGERSYIYMDRREAVVNLADGESVSVSSEAGSGVAVVRNADGTETYLTLGTHDGTQSGVAFAVRKITGVEPSAEFIEITADAGAHGQNVGYWLIGKAGGKWGIYVSIDALTSIGYTANEWHQIHTDVTDGKLILTSSHEYMPPGAEFQYQRQHVDDLRAELFWDDAAQWFGMRRIF